MTGASGYVGSSLVPTLLEQGHSVIALDTFWFGDHLGSNSKLLKVKKDIRDIKAEDLPEFDSVIHLASISNDPSVELDPNLSWEIGCLGTLNLCQISAQRGINSFILASSGSVYGLKEEPNVTENLSLVPISIYNKVKMIKERIVMSFSQEFRVVIYRPATICGWSPRLRLDLAVNTLTYDALSQGKMKIFGGGQMRPQLHIKDMVEAYLWALDNKLMQGVFNVGFENDSILDIARKVQELIPAKFEILASNDIRSYRIDSTKLLQTGFVPKHKTRNAITELAEVFNKIGISASDQNYNVLWMKTLLISRDSQEK